MNIQHLRIQNFRCFTDASFAFSNQCTVIEGNNASGKTSLLEALYYGCYLRSFRTRSSKDLVRFGSAHFFLTIQVDTARHEQESIYVGFEGNDKVVKLNSQSVGSYKELIDHYRILSLSESDMQLIQGPPEERRAFLDHALFLDSEEALSLFKTYKPILMNRNSLLARSKSAHFQEIKQLEIWSEQLWKTTREIQALRIRLLSELEGRVNSLIAAYFHDAPYDLSLTLTYKEKNMGGHEDFASFWNEHLKGCLENEIRFKRSLFGAHLDDVLITFKDRQVRQFASRGQQKAVTFLLKIAHYNLLAEGGKEACLLLDDFLTDFDARMLGRCLSVLATTKAQYFITCPLESFFLKNLLPQSTSFIRL